MCKCLGPVFSFGLLFVSGPILSGCSTAMPGAVDDGSSDNDGVESPDGTDPEDMGNPTCARYCEFIQAACGNVGAFTSQYESEDSCVEYCETRAALPAGTLDDRSGNSIGCRLFYAEQALTAVGAIERQELCEQAGPSGGNLCGTWCENYCFLSMLNCAGHGLHPENEAECMIVCGGFNEQGRPGALTGNSVQCRIQHLGEAGNPAQISGNEDPPPPVDQTGQLVTSHRQWHCPLGAPVSTDADGSEGPCQ